MTGTNQQTNDEILRERLRRDARAMFHAGVEAVDPRHAVRRWVHREGLKLRIGKNSGSMTEIDLAACRQIVVVGAGKASAQMGAAIEELLEDQPYRGIVVIPHGYPSPLRRLRTIYAAHPVPDHHGIAAAREVSGEVAGGEPGDLVIALFSGGGSALLPAPAGGMSLEEKQQVTTLLLRSGAAIDEVNTVRKHLSFLKGGRLSRLAGRAQVLALLLSDVIGDDPATIASGPTAPDPTTSADALSILQQYGLTESVPPKAREVLRQGADESPKPGDPLFAHVQNIIVGCNADALSAMERTAEELGYATIVERESIRGEARRAAASHIRKCIELAAAHGGRPLCILSGGETTVTVQGNGRGGRNQEFALSAALALEGFHGTVLLSAGTDGIDGPTSAAGAFADWTTCGRARALGFAPERFLERNDSNSFFLGLGDLCVTGATGTNVMDVQILLRA